MSVDLAEEVVVYRCRCGFTSKDEDEAQECCPNVEEETVHECCSCEKTYKDEEQARKCCLEESLIIIECPACDERWRVDSDQGLEKAVEAARRCCNDPEEKTKYCCTECNKEHGSNDDAMGCCPHVSEVKMWECPGCDFRSEDKGRAMIHCQYQD